jgi:hypothetical protein
MDRTELLERVRELRGQGRSPKEIARALKVPPSVVAPLVRAIAAETRETPVSEPELVGCWVNAGWSAGLSVDPARGWIDKAPEADGAAGKATVLVAWKHGWDKVVAGGYLVDTYCLGVKDTLGPLVMDEMELHRLRAECYRTYPAGWQDAPVELARDLVYGSIEYAGGLGFEPMTAPEVIAGHLGAWDGTGAIAFGREGRPFFFAGANDNVPFVLRTLEGAVGADGFGYMVPEE